MDEFFKQLPLSNDAIEIYKGALGKVPLTFNELHLLIGDLSIENFTKILNELKNANLIVEIAPQKPEILQHYIAIPPFTPILTYYTNIKANLSTIQDAVQGLIVNSLNEIFKNKKKNKIELDTLLKQFQEINNDIAEDSLIQKQDVEEIIKDFENLKKIKKTLGKIKSLKDNLYRQIENTIQTEFMQLLKTLTTIKTEISNHIRLLELKKKEPKVIAVIEDIFKANLNKILQDFSSKLLEIIGLEFKNFEVPLKKAIITPINNTVDETFQFQNDFKLLYLNVINDFELKMNKIHEIIMNNKTNLENELHNLIDAISTNVNEIARDSIDQVSMLSKPIENTMGQFMTRLMQTELLNIDNIWIIKSNIKIQDEIQHLLTTSKNELILIIPNLEPYLNIEQFSNLPPELKIKIVSSEHHTNSVVKKFKEIPNIEFRTFKNEKIIALFSDNKYLVINILQEFSKDPLNNVIGISINYLPLINFLKPIITTTWNTAEPEYATPGKHKIPPKPIPVRKPEPIKTPPVSTVKQQLKSKLEEKAQFIGNVQQIKTPISPPKQEVPIIPPDPFTTTTTPSQIPPAPSPAPEASIKKESHEVSQQIGDFISRFPPKPGDQTAEQINNAFNMLISQFNVIKGEDLSRELENIADLILMKRGFSFILHDIRKLINDYKAKFTLLDNNDKALIFEAIESWKERLF